jgi:hypothetical protein
VNRLVARRARRSRQNVRRRERPAVARQCKRWPNPLTPRHLDVRSLNLATGEAPLDVKIQTSQRERALNRLCRLVGGLGCESIHHMLVDKLCITTCKRVCAQSIECLHITHTGLTKRRRATRTNGRDRQALTQTGGLEGMRSGRSYQSVEGILMLKPTTVRRSLDRMVRCFCRHHRSCCIS